MATVYLAHDPRFNRQVAIKVLPRQFTHDPTFRARFEREAQVIANLEHPAIVPVHDFGEEEEQPYLVMRYMPGGSLADLLQQGSLSPNKVAEILMRIAHALDRAHSQGVIHRDLKPGNILFDQYGDPYLADFGIAKLAEATATITGSSIIGTPAYMSPEQVKGQKLDGRSDIYTLAVIVFEMLTGRQPYEAETPMGQAFKHVLEPVPHILEGNPELPQAVDEVLMRGLAKEPDDRFATAVDFMRALETAVSLPETPVTPQLQPQTDRQNLPSDRTVVENAILHEIDNGATIVQTTHERTAFQVDNSFVLDMPTMPADKKPRTVFHKQRAWAIGVIFLIAAGVIAAIVLRNRDGQETVQSPFAVAVLKQEQGGVSGQGHEIWEGVLVSPQFSAPISFNSMPEYWLRSSPLHVSLADGEASIQGTGGWQSSLQWQRVFTGGQGVLCLFKYAVGTEARIFLFDGDVNSTSYLGYGLSIDPYTLYPERVVGYMPNGQEFQTGSDLSWRPHSWYYVFLGIDNDGSLILRVWPKDEPDSFAVHQYEFSSIYVADRDLADARWRFAFMAKSGQVIVDEVTAVYFDGLN